MELSHESQQTCDMDAKQRQESRSATLPAVVQDGVNETQAKLLEEMFDTESSYVEDLEILKECINKVQGRLGRSSSVSREIEKSQLNKLCAMVRDLCRLHVELHVRLKRALSKKSEDVADIYEDFCKDLSLYERYIDVYYEILFDADEHTSIRWHRDLTARMQEIPRFTGMTIRDFLFIPLQRLMRYSLLLSTFLKKVEDPTQPSIAKLSKSLKSIKKTTDKVDVRTGVKANMKKLFELQKRIKKADLFASDRLFVREASVDKIHARGRLKTVKRVLFLFSDILLICEDVEPHVVKHELSTATIKILDLSRLSTPVDDTSTTVLRLFGGGLSKYLTFQFENSIIRDEWIKALTALSNASKASSKDSSDGGRGDVGELIFSKPPLFVRDERVTSCYTCRTPFSLLLRKHHCRGCGVVVCRKCWQHKWALPYTDGKMVNVCEECHQIMQAVQDSASSQQPIASNSTPDDQQEANGTDSDSDGSQTQPASPAADSSGDSDKTPAVGADSERL